MDNQREVSWTFLLHIKSLPTVTLIDITITRLPFYTVKDIPENAEDNIIHTLKWLKIKTKMGPKLELFYAHERAQGYKNIFVTIDFF